MMDVTRGDRGEVVIRIDGTFDSKAALRLEGWLGEVSPGDDVVLDFSHVSSLPDLGLAAVAEDLAQRGAHVQVRGLTRHQERLLRYFGVDVDRIAVHLRGDRDALG